MNSNNINFNFFQQLSRDISDDMIIGSTEENKQFAMDDIPFLSLHSSPNETRIPILYHNDYSLDETILLEETMAVDDSVLSNLIYYHIKTSSFLMSNKTLMLNPIDVFTLDIMNELNNPSYIIKSTTIQFDTNTNLQSQLESILLKSIKQSIPSNIDRIEFYTAEYPSTEYIVQNYVKVTANTLRELVFQRFFRLKDVHIFYRFVGLYSSFSSGSCAEAVRKNNRKLSQLLSVTQKMEEEDIIESKMDIKSEDTVSERFILDAFRPITYKPLYNIRAKFIREVILSYLNQYEMLISGCFQLPSFDKESILYRWKQIQSVKNRIDMIASSYKRIYEPIVIHETQILRDLIQDIQSKTTVNTIHVTYHAQFTSFKGIVNSIETTGSFYSSEDDIKKFQKPYVFTRTNGDLIHEIYTEYKLKRILFKHREQIATIIVLEFVPGWTMDMINKQLPIARFE